MKGSTDEDQTGQQIENLESSLAVDPCSYQGLHSHSKHLLFPFYSKDLRYRIWLEYIEAFVLLVLE